MIEGILCNDIHSKLNPTRVARVVCPESTAEVARLVLETAAVGGTLSICGARHAMGGQQFGEGTVLIDGSGLCQIGQVDRSSGVVEIGAGVKWRELIAALHLSHRRVWRNS